MLARIFKAKYRKGSIEPLEPLEFPEEADLVVTAEEAGTVGLEAAPENIWTGYDPKKAVAAFRESSGALKGIDAEARIAAIYRAREEGTRPISRP